MRLGARSEEARATGRGHVPRPRRGALEDRSGDGPDHPAGPRRPSHCRTGGTRTSHSIEFNHPHTEWLLGACSRPPGPRCRRRRINARPAEPAELAVHRIACAGRSRFLCRRTGVAAAVQQFRSTSPVAAVRRTVVPRS
jgi:hypothetical protein